MEKILPTRPKAFLIDMDGTLYFKGEPCPGAIETVNYLRQEKYQLRFLTNTTAKTPKMLHAQMQALGFDIHEDEIFNATYACLQYLRSQPGTSCHFMVDDAVKAFFKEIPVDDDAPDFVVVGDYGEGFDFRTLNHAFRLLMNGAELIALQKNLYWFSAEGMFLDCGAFVTLLEAAASKTATVMGKPSETFFKIALESLQLSPSEAVVVGDDVTSDIVGAENTKLRSILVKTGKFKPNQLENPVAKPTWILDSIAELPNMF
ncbi:TIGR01458 family HAD-type hydrolase [Candidatus Poribacteria bacterium]|nr:TIGR01458 family HAD-type hydrolase [Candidatus Poribacteria bacterium]MYH82621.1 TIGR01458 family HAD-type hydrolase [Candidatus Poribacteria bacterium]MYK93887.1 TIGR01458 family HAD-type hydrolase [Candidatus Poribacteria bacterium]